MRIQGSVLRARIRSCGLNTRYRRGFAPGPGGIYRDGKARVIRNPVRPGPGQVIVEPGGWTVREVEFYETAVPGLNSVHAAEPRPSHPEPARQRCRRWPNVHVAGTDAVDYHPAGPVDQVYFSYSRSLEFGRGDFFARRHGGTIVYDTLRRHAPDVVAISNVAATLPCPPQLGRESDSNSMPVPG